MLVASRHTLAGLGARLVDITTLGPGASVDLLDSAVRAARPDDTRIADDPQAAGRLAGLCGGLSALQGPKRPQPGQQEPPPSVMAEHVSSDATVQLDGALRMVRISAVDAEDGVEVDEPAALE